MVDQLGRLPPSCDGALIEKSCLIAPTIPARSALSGKKLNVRAIYEPLNPLYYLIGFAAVLTSRCNDKPAYIPAPTLRFAACGE